jgi:hypothetical protein
MSDPRYEFIPPLPEGAKIEYTTGFIAEALTSTHRAAPGIKQSMVGQEADLPAEGMVRLKVGSCAGGFSSLEMTVEQFEMVAERNGIKPQPGATVYDAVINQYIFGAYSGNRVVSLAAPLPQPDILCKGTCGIEG